MVLVLAIASIAAATLTPVGDAPTHGFTCVFCGERALADVLANVVLYIPLGVGLRLAGIRAGRAVLLGALISAGIEFVQIAVPGRDASIGDVISNTVGTAVGAALTAWAPVWLAPPPRLSRILAPTWALVCAVIWWGAGWLFAPSFPETRYASLWAPNLEHLEWYRARVLSVTVGDMPSPNQRVPDSAILRRRLLDGAPITVRTIVAPRPPGLAPVFAVYDENSNEVILLGPEGGELVFRYRARATDFRLDEPDLRRDWPEHEGPLPGDTVRLSVSPASGGDGWCLRVDASERCGLGFTVGDAWTLMFYPESFAGWLTTTVRLGWLLVLVVPAGLWIRRRLDLGIVVAILVLGLLLAPATTVLRATPAAQWLAVVAGLTIGMAARGVVRHGRPDAPRPANGPTRG